MQKIEIALSDEGLYQLRLLAESQGSQVEEYLAALLRKSIPGVLSTKPKTWMPRTQWDALIRGENCPLCRPNEQIDAFGYTVADLSLSCFRLMANQSVPGFCVLFCTRHVREPFELSIEDRSRFFGDILLAAQAIEQAYGPIKLNYEILGNVVPHLHCYIKPRYYGDPAPGAPIHPDQHVVRLSVIEYEERVQALRKALEELA